MFLLQRRRKNVVKGLPFSCSARDASIIPNIRELIRSRVRVVHNLTAVVETIGGVVVTELAIVAWLNPEVGRVLGVRRFENHPNETVNPAS